MHVDDLFSQKPSDDTPIACDLSVLDDPEEHHRHSETLFAERQELRQIDGGIALRYPGTIEYAERLLGFISRERQCCPFLTFKLVFEPEDRGLWLCFGGDERVEAYLAK